jgi:hypothetical protein
MTVQGLSPVSTVMPPSTACAGMPRKPTRASARMPGRTGRCRHTATRSASTIAPSTKVSSRLPNSMTPWTAYSAVGV